MEMIYLTLTVPRDEQTTPIGLKHCQKDEPLLKAWLGLLLLAETLKFLFSIKPKHEARHMRKESLWQQRIAEKIDAVDIVLELLPFIISKLVSHFRRGLQEMLSEIKLYVHRLSQKKNELIANLNEIKRNVAEKSEEKLWAITSILMRFVRR